MGTTHFMNSMAELAKDRAPPATMVMDDMDFEASTDRA